MTAVKESFVLPPHQRNRSVRRCAVAGGGTQGASGGGAASGGALPVPGSPPCGLAVAREPSGP